MRKFVLLLLCAATTTSLFAVKGASPGVFSVSPTKKIVFSMGNLQYQPSTSTWQFAKQQIDTIGVANADIAADYEGWIDLFGWGTGDAPTKTAADAEYAWTDWGTNTISTSGNVTNTWFSLSKEEWIYLLHERPNAEKLFALATVRGVRGLILMPDRWIDRPCTNPAITPSTEQGMKWEEGTDFQFYGGTIQDYCAKNVFDSAQWWTLELYNLVFLPAAGIREGSGENSVTNVNTSGMYWMPDKAADATKSTSLSLSSWKINPDYADLPSKGHAVRLVAECVDTVRLSFEKPEPKMTVPEYNIYPTSPEYNVIGKVSKPENARYEILSYHYYSTDGNSITDTKFSPNTSYMVQVIVKAKDGYTFPTGRGNDYPNRYSMELIVNDEVSSKYSYWNNGTIGLQYIFTTDQTEEIANPVFSNTAYGIVDTATVAITCGTPDVSIYYTTNGAVPSATTGTRYTQPLFFDVATMKDKETLTLRAIAYRDDEASEVSTYTYQLFRTETTLHLQYDAEGQGTATLPETAKYGDEITVKVKPAVGYKLDKITVAGEEIQGTTFIVPASRKNLYVRVYFKKIEQADPTDVTNITITPGDNSVTVVWPAVDGAATYELVIKDEAGEVVCTLVFNASGQLTSINFNPAKRSNAPQLTQSIGFSFTVNGLDEAAGYALTLTAKDNEGAVLDQQVQYFATTGGPTALYQLNHQSSIINYKLIKNGQLFIRQGNKIYNAHGARVE